MTCIQVLGTYKQSFLNSFRRDNPCGNAERGSIMSFRSSPIMMVLVVMLMAVPGWAIDIHVDSDAPGPHTGSTWINAYVYLQDALAVAQYGDTIKVGQGHYWPDQGTVPHIEGRHAAFHLKPGVTVLGGFAGYNVALPSWQFGDRNVQLYQSVLTGDLNGDDLVAEPNNVSDMASLVTSPLRQDNCYSVVNASDTDPNSVLDGFTISGGNANDSGSQAPLITSHGGGVVFSMGSANITACTITQCSALRGGGFHAMDADPNVSDCTFILNSAEIFGGAMWYKASHIRVSQTEFEQNRAGFSNTRGKAGAIYAVDSNSMIDSCVFKQNTGNLGGGAIFFDDGEPNVANSFFYENESRSGAGGAVRLQGGCIALMSNSRFVGNETNNPGGAIASYYSSASFVDCTYIRNKSKSDGGAIYSDSSEPNFVNCVFNGNTARGFGGAISSLDTVSDIVNCTFASNEGDDGGNALSTNTLSVGSASSIIRISNSILWNGSNEIFNIDGSTITVTYSTLSSLWPGRGNSQFSPGFINEHGEDRMPGNEDDNLMLSVPSSAIDSGDNYAVPDGILKDLVHAPRFMDNQDVADAGRSDGRYVVDRGAYEFGDPCSLAPPVANAGPDQNVSASYDGQATVIMDGSGSEDPDGDLLQYRWTWSLSGQTKHASGVRPTILLPAGPHVIQLVVTDGLTDSDPDYVTITVVSTGGRPTANAGPDQTVILPTGSIATVLLNGSGSQDPDSDPLEYLWTWVADGQSGQTSGVNPIIQLPLGHHMIQLVVFDGTHYSEPDAVVIRVSRPNQDPVANAGPDQTVSSSGGQVGVTLDGSGSYDPDGSVIEYAWTWTAGGQVKTATGVRPVIVLPSGQYSVQLIVSDGTASSQADYVSIVVLQSNQIPVANAGPDQTVVLPSGSGPASVGLNGSASYDPDGTISQYFWSWTVGTMQNTVTGVSPTILLPAGQFSVKLIVYDGEDYSQADYVQITVTQNNQAPVANAGPDQTKAVTSGNQASVILDGTGSSDPDSTIVAYYWSWIASGQNHTATGATPTISLPVGLYSIQLVVYDGEAYSQTDTVIITVTQGNQPPVANAGPDQAQTVSAGGLASVILNGTGSSDPDGTIVAYYWSWIAGGQNRTATGATPTISLPVGLYSIQLVVYDGQAYSQADTVIITVTQGNQAPVANAGPDQTKTVNAGGLATVTLNGSASHDPDGTISQYIWSWIVNGQPRQAAGVSPIISLPVGQYSIQLVVYDAQTQSPADTVVVTVTQTNQPPVANAGPDQTKTVAAGGQASVTLNGSASHDPDGTISQYVWSWTLNGQLRQAAGVSPTISLPVGQYSIQLVVYDNQTNSQADTVVITVSQTNQPPVADAGPDQTRTVTAGNQASVTLNGSGSTDPDGTITNYHWTWVVNGQTQSVAGITPTILLPVGQYAIQLVVYDGQLNSPADTVLITVTQTNQPPVANAGPDQTVPATAGTLASVTLDGSGSYDLDGVITRYFWSWVVNGQSRQATGVSPVITLGVGQYSVQLVVFDGAAYSQIDTASIIVTQSNQAPVADAGPDQSVSIASGTLASVMLDGSGSYDPDGVVTQYVWSWTINGQPYQVLGSNPTIQLPYGQHTVVLAVSDGVVTSAPDQVVITVTQSAQAIVNIWTDPITPYDSQNYVNMLVTLPNTLASNVNTGVPMTLFPGGIQSIGQNAWQSGSDAVMVAIFDEATVLNAIPISGTVSMTVYGQFLSGQQFSGSDSVTLVH